MNAKLMGTIALAASFCVGGCGSDDAGNDGMPGYGGTSGTSGTSATGAAVNVTLGEYEVTVAPASATAGEITFSIENTGDDAHEFVVVMTDLAAADLPTHSDGSFDEQGEGVEVVDEVDLIAPGDSEELSVDLDPGSYLLVCNFVVPEDDGLESHFHEGMVAPFTVE